MRSRIWEVKIMAYVPVRSQRQTVLSALVELVLQFCVWNPMRSLSSATPHAISDVFDGGMYYRVWMKIVVFRFLPSPPHRIHNRHHNVREWHELCVHWKREASVREHKREEKKRKRTRSQFIPNSIVCKTSSSMCDMRGRKSKKYIACEQWGKTKGKLAQTRKGFSGTGHIEMKK